MTNPAQVHEPLDTTRFLEKIKKAESEAWLRQWCNSNDCPEYDIVMAAIVGDTIPEQGGWEDYGRSYENHGDYITFYGRDAHASIPDEFWDHVEIVTGMTFDVRDRVSGFSCSC